MSSFSAEYTTKRNDHANWQTPSRRRGTYFGTYAAPKESIRRSPAPSQSQSQDGQTARSDGGASGSSRNQARNGSAGATGNRRANPHARTQRFLTRVSKKRITGKFGADEIGLFRRKNAELEEQVDALQKNLEELERDHFVLQGEFQICEGNLEQTTEELKSTQEENKRVNGLLIIEKARAQEAADKVTAVEKKFQEEFDEYKALSSKTIESLEASLDDVSEQLKTTQRQLRDMFELKEENQRRKEECKRMKQSLVKVSFLCLARVVMWMHGCRAKQSPARLMSFVCVSFLRMTGKGLHPTQSSECHRGGE